MSAIDYLREQNWRFLANCADFYPSKMGGTKLPHFGKPRGTGGKSC